MHLLDDEGGDFPLDRNEWEAEVLDREHDRAGFIGWYRNPSRSSQDSLAIAYEHGGRVRTVRPDFVFCNEHDDGKIGAAIVDPHGHHLGDALPKLRGLAGYAERHGHHFDRIDAVAKIGEKLRVLDLAEPSVRAAVATATDAASRLPRRARQRLLNDPREPRVGDAPRRSRPMGPARVGEDVGGSGMICSGEVTLP
jgi:hypothetical protein